MPLAKKEYVFANLKLLKSDMEAKAWVIDSFYFHYKEQAYIVLVKLFDENEPKGKYDLVKLEFLKEDNIHDCLSVIANAVRFLPDEEGVRRYFKLGRGNSNGDALIYFKEAFAKFIPAKMTNSKTLAQQHAMVRSLSQSDSEDPTKIYCLKVRRNGLKKDGTPGQRTPFNDNKTRVLRKKLYERLKDETNLSFCYSSDQREERSDEVILTNWAKGNH